MAYGFRNNATAVNDGGSRKRTEQEQQQALAEAQRRANDEWAKQQAEADWAARMEEQRRQERVEAQNYSAPAPQPQQTITNYPKPNPQKRDAQRAADQAAAQQDAQNNAWKNIIDYSEPSALTSNGQTITNKNTGETYSTPNYAQQAAEEQARRQAEEQARREEQARQEQMKRERELAMEQLRQQELARQQELQRQAEEARRNAGNMVVPEGYNTLPDTNSGTSTQQYATSEPQTTQGQARYYEPNGGMVLPPNYRDRVTATTAPSRDYTDEEISQMQRGRGNRVVPRTYSPTEQNKENTAGLPAGRENDSDRLADWQVLQNTPDSSDTPVNDWVNVVDTGSALGGTNITPNSPYDFTRYQYYQGRGLSDSQAKQEAQRDYAISHPNRVEPNSAIENDFFYQLGISEGLTPEEAIEYMRDEYALADNAPSYDSLGDFIVNGVLNGEEGRERLADANQKVEDLYANIPNNPYLGNPEAAVDHYLENGGAERDAALKAWYRNTRNDFATANQKNDVAQDYINAKMEMDGKTRKDYSNKDWFKLEAEANAYAEEMVNTPAKTTTEYQLEQINNRRNQDNATLEDVVDQLDTVGQNTPTTSEMEQILDDLGIKTPAGYMPYGDPRQNNNNPNASTNTATPSSTSVYTNPNVSGGYDQNVADYMANTPNNSGTNRRDDLVREAEAAATQAGFDRGTKEFDDLVEQYITEGISGQGNNTSLWDRIITGVKSGVDKIGDLFSKDEEPTSPTTSSTPSTTNTTPQRNEPTTKRSDYNERVKQALDAGYIPNTPEFDMYVAGEITTPNTSKAGQTTKGSGQEFMLTGSDVMNIYLDQTGKNLEDLSASDWKNVIDLSREVANTPLDENGNSTVVDKNGKYTGKNAIGNIIFNPSYGQDMEYGVKLPYKQGGYSASDLEAAGNKPYTDANGRTQYEGYYYWNGNWYPVDQQKAEYYQRYGTYNGWDEGMRDYFNTFGTFYGYTPTWRETGRNVRTNSGGGYSGSYSRSYSPSYSGGYYGNGRNYPTYGNVNPDTALQEQRRINNIRKNWSFNG